MSVRVRKRIESRDRRRHGHCGWCRGDRDDGHIHPGSGRDVRKWELGGRDRRSGIALIADDGSVKRFYSERPVADADFGPESLLTFGTYDEPAMIFTVDVSAGLSDLERVETSPMDFVSSIRWADNGSALVLDGVISPDRAVPVLQILRFDER